MEKLSGKIHTVLGAMDPKSAGITMTHEHLSMLFDFTHVPAKDDEYKMMECPFTIENLGWIRQNPFSHRSNLVFNDDETHAAVVEEMHSFKANGGGTIVENSVHGLCRNTKFLKELAEKSGVNIISGTGFYVASSQTPSTLNSKVEELASVMRDEITVGCKESGVKCGLIGEIGCSWPLHEFESNVLEAAAIVQGELGCPVMIHPGRNQDAPFKILRKLQEAGGNVEKTVMAHLDRTIFDETELMEFAALGSYCEFDLFGIETSYYQMNDAVDMPSDAQRIQHIWNLVDEGFENKVVISHDMYSKHRLTKFGGHGYSHILKYVVPKMLSRGLSQNIIDKILIHNPRAWLTFQ